MIIDILEVRKSSGANEFNSLAPLLFRYLGYRILAITDAKKYS